jgi:hypothetical protein
MLVASLLRSLPGVRHDCGNCGRRRTCARPAPNEFGAAITLKKEQNHAYARLCRSPTQTAAAAGGGARRREPARCGCGVVMRGSGSPNRWTCGVQAALAVVMLAGHDCRIVLGEQAAVEGDLEEAAISLLRRMPLAGKLVSMDAGPLHRGSVKAIEKKGGLRKCRLLRTRCHLCRRLPPRSQNRLRAGCPPQYCHQLDSACRFSLHP